MSELRRTLVALALLAALVLAWYAMTAPGALTGEDDLVVVAVDPSQLQAVRVRNAFGSWSLTRTPDGAWRVGGGADGDHPGDGAAVAAFLADLRRLHALRVIPEGTVDDDAAGLQAPAAQVSWTGPGIEGSLQVGAPNRLGGTAYVRRDGRHELLLVPLPRVAGFLASPQALRDRTVARIPVDELRSLTVRHGDEARRFVRSEGGSWTLETPTTRLPVFPPRLAELCETLTALRAEGFLGPSTPLASLGLQPPRIRIEAHFDPPLLPVGLSVGDRSPDSSLLCTLLRDDVPGVILVAADVLTALAADDDEFRDQSPFTIPGEPPTWLRLETAGDQGREAEILLRGDTWKVSVPARPAVDPGPLLELIRSARATQYRRFPNEDLSTYGLAEPRCRLLMAAHNDDAKVFRLGVAASGRAYALLPDQAVAEIPPSVVEGVAAFLDETGRPRSDG